jgi:hypothetical protein
MIEAGANGEAAQGTGDRLQTIDEVVDNVARFLLRSWSWTCSSSATDHLIRSGTVAAITPYA